MRADALPHRLVRPNSFLVFFHPGNPPAHSGGMPGAATQPRTATQPRYYMLRDVNLFASGVYRGRRWFPHWVRNMAEAGRKLGPGGAKLHTPPAAPGHEDDEGWREFVPTDEPAAGWVDPNSLRAVPDPQHAGHVILKGNVVNVPEAMARKIESGEYRFGSAEIYDSFLDDFGRKYGKVLRKFSYLGGEVPQVKRLGPLPRPEPMPAPMRFSERPGVRIREHTVRGRRGALITFAETSRMDRQSMIAAIQADMPGISQSTLDAMTDEALADLVKNLPTGAGTPTPPANPAPAPATGMFAEPSREEMIAALVDEGEDAAELEGMSDEELGALYEEVIGESTETEGEGEEPVETMADPAAVTREEMIADLVAQGQDAAALDAMPDDQLRALYAQLTADPPAPPAAPAPAPAAVPMSEPRRKPRPKPATRRGVTVNSELAIKAKRLNAALDNELSRLRVSNERRKRDDATKFCDQLVSEGRATPAQVTAAYLPLLLGLDDTRAVHRFTENGRTRNLTAYEARKAQLAQMPVTVKFGERFAAGPPAGEFSGEAELAKVKQFAAAAVPESHREQYVTSFAELQKKKPRITAKEYGAR